MGSDVRDIARRRRSALAGAVLLTSLLTGCQGGTAGPFARWRMLGDKGIAKPITEQEMGDNRPLIMRLIRPKAPPSNAADTSGTLLAGSDGWTPIKPPPPDPETEAAFKSAEALFQQGALAEAEKGFARLAKKKRGNTWGEKSQFYLAECQFQQGHLVKAHDSYEKLFADYPGTRYIDQIVAREYAIAQDWMKGLTPDAAKADRPSLASWWNGRTPAVDVSGHTLSVLEHVRHHDPTGPLADDATLRIADYHYENENFEDAGIYYDQLITDHPKSDLLQKAYLASIDAKMKSYIGPEYDGAGLEQARTLVDQTESVFPERRAAYSTEMNKTVALIDDQMAERAYKVAEHYMWTGKVTSAEYCFGEIPAKWPKSPWAAKAKVQLEKLAHMPRPGDEGQHHSHDPRQLRPDEHGRRCPGRLHARHGRDEQHGRRHGRHGWALSMRRLGMNAKVCSRALSRRALLAGLLACSTLGCGYTIRPPYETRIRTVYVPLFKSVSFRRDLNKQLTELIMKEIERRTPYKVVGSPEGADSTLDGTIVLADKNLMVENPNNLPREVMNTLTVTVRWTDNTTGQTVEEQSLAPVPVTDNAALFSELGETTQLGYYTAMQRIASEIVNMMEERW